MKCATTRWTAAHIAAIAESRSTQAPVIEEDRVGRILPDIDFWDLWPVRERSSVDADAYSGHWGPQFNRAARTGRDTAAACVKSARRFFSTITPR